MKPVFIIVALISTSLALFFMFHSHLITESTSSDPLTARFLESGALRFSHSQSVKKITVYDDAHRPVAIAKPFRRSTIDLRFNWRPSSIYTILTDDGPSISLRSPSSLPRFVLRCHAPLGQKPKEVIYSSRATSPVPIDLRVPTQLGESVSVMIELEKLIDKGVDPVELSWTGNENHQLAIDGLNPLYRTQLDSEFDKKIWPFSVTARQWNPRTPIRLVLKIGALVVPIRLYVVPQPSASETIQTGKWLMPTESDGKRLIQRPANQITMPSAFWNRIAAWFNIRLRDINFSLPFSYQSIEITNRLKTPLTVLIQEEVLTPDTKRPVSYFQVPDVQRKGGSDKTAVFVQVDPGATETAVLPIYVSPETPAGLYLRRLTVTRLGSDRVLKRVEETFSVVRSSDFQTFWTLFIVAISLLWGVTVLLCYQKLVTSFGVRRLVLLSLLGTVQFCLSFASGLVSSLFFALLGPFNCLVGGLLSEVLTYLLITSILYLVPRVGAMTLAGVVSYMIGGVMFGSFGLIDILYTGSTIVFWELSLFLFGITSLKKESGAPPRLILLMLSLGVADAASTFTSMILQSVFYRLFFADWYFILQVGVTGCLYTMVGVYLGKSLGHNLRNVRL